MRNQYGIQMYSIRDLSQNNLEKALAAVAEIGYSYVEFAGFFGNSAEDVLAMLKKYGLKVSGTHTGWQELKPEVLHETIAYHKTLGNKNIISPGFGRSDESFDEMVKTINYALPILKENGITLGYHNHSYEYLESPSGRYYHKELEEKTEVEFQIDTFWAFNAKLDPVAEIERLKDRIKVIHLKDGIPSEDGFEAGSVGKSVGSGKAPIDKIIAKAEELGLLMVVESEGLDPTGRDEVARCMDYLKENG